MLKRLLYLSIYLSIYLSSRGQVNLVPNYSFEDTVSNNCNFYMVLNSSTTTNSYTKNWYSVVGTPDFYNICANAITGNANNSSTPLSCQGYQIPHTGNSYAGSLLYVVSSDSIQILTEPFSVNLKQALKPNACYYGEFYISLANMSDVAINQASMLFTQSLFTTTIGSYTNSIQPQIQWDTTKLFTDTLLWTKIAGTFVAQGGEQYLTIGNFRDGAHLKKTFLISGWTNPSSCGITTNKGSYIFIDDVSLYELPSHTGTQSYTLCAGDSLLLGDTVSLPVRYQWSLNGVVVDTTKNIIIKNAGTYILQTKHCTTQTQTITIVIDKNCNSTDALEIPNVFTPNGDNVNDTFSFKVVGAKNLIFGVYNRWGILIHQTTNNQTTVLWDGRTTSGEACSAGIYFYVLEYTNPNGELKKKNGYISLIR